MKLNHFNILINDLVDKYTFLTAFFFNFFIIVNF